MKNNTGRNIFLVVLGYYLLTGNYKAARNMVIAYVVMLLIVGCIFWGIASKNEAESSRQWAYQQELQAEQNKKNRQEAEQYVADVLPAFVNQFKGKTMTGEFYDIGGLDGYSIKFKIIDDATLSYQISENEDPLAYSFQNKHNWGKSKKCAYTLQPALRDDGSVIKERLIFQFESYNGELDVMRSEKKKKFKILTPLTLKDADDNYATFWDW